VERRTKRRRLESRGRENGRILMRSKSILLFLRARAGSIKHIFFLLIIGFKGIKLYNRLVLEN
jgi:hypothetical protein